MLDAQEIFTALVELEGDELDEVAIDLIRRSVFGGDNIEVKNYASRNVIYDPEAVDPERLLLNSYEIRQLSGTSIKFTGTGSYTEHIPRRPPRSEVDTVSGRILVSTELKISPYGYYGSAQVYGSEYE